MAKIKGYLYCAIITIILIVLTIPISIAETKEPNSALKLPEPGLLGSWLGYVECSDGRKRPRHHPADSFPFFLEFKEESPVAADLYILVERNSHHAISGKVTGTFDPNSRNLSLETVEWIYPNTNRYNRITEPPTIKATLDQSGLHLEGEITLLPEMKICKSISAIKFLRDDRPLNPDGLLAKITDYNDAWKFSDKEVCRKFLTWEIGGTITEIQRVRVPSQVMDGDTFYSILGKTYDQWTDTDEKIFSGLENGCWRTFEPLRKSTNIKDSNLANKVAKDYGYLGKFLIYSIPTGDNLKKSGSHIKHYDYLNNYAIVVALRNARLYADLQLQEARKLATTPGNIERIEADIATVEKSEGIFATLPADEKKRQLAELKSIKEGLAAKLTTETAQHFDIERYPQNLQGLKQAWIDRKALEKDASEYTNPSQKQAFIKNLNTAFIPLSKSVADKTLSSMRNIENTVHGFIRGKQEKQDIDNKVIPHLLPADKQRVIDAYEERNENIIRKILPGFPEWLKQNIPSNNNGKAALNKLSIDMLDRNLNKLRKANLSSPYRDIASAILARKNQLKQEICEVPEGFEELRDQICAK